MSDIHPRRLDILILEATPLLSMDLAEEVTAQAPGAAVHVLRSPDQLRELLARNMTFDLAFVGWDLSRAVHHELREALWASCRGVALLADRSVTEIGDLPDHVQILVRPYAPRLVRAQVAAAAAAAAPPS